MDSTEAFSPPPQWVVDQIGPKSASFSNGERGLEVELWAVSKGSKAQKRGYEPTHYVVQLRQDWFSRGTLGEQNMAAKVDTRDDAFTVVQEFMAEFSREVEELPWDEVEATHRATGNDHEAAEHILTTEVAAEALADAAGYSDDLLVSVLTAETNDQYRCIVHRNGSTLTTAAGEDTAVTGDISIQTQLDAFSNDNARFQHIVHEYFKHQDRLGAAYAADRAVPRSTEG